MYREDYYGLSTNPGVLAQCALVLLFLPPPPQTPFFFPSLEFCKDFDLFLFLSAISSFEDSLVDHVSLSFFVVLGVEPRASCILGKHPATELRPGS